MCVLIDNAGECGGFGDFIMIVKVGVKPGEPMRVLYNSESGKEMAEKLLAAFGEPINNNPGQHCKVHRKRDW